MRYQHLAISIAGFNQVFLPVEGREKAAAQGLKAP
jgi:hypothetical protein